MTADWVWVVFFILLIPAAAWFVAFETRALLNKDPGDTLSEYIRKRTGIDPPDTTRRVWAIFFLLIFVVGPIWFVPHIVWQIW